MNDVNDRDDLELSEQEKQERRARLNERSAQHRHARANIPLRRYTIRLMRIAFPLIGFGLLLVVFFIPQFEKQIIEPTLDQEKAKQTLERLELEKPRYQSYDDNQNPYTVTADQASRENETPNKVDLNNPHATLEMKTGKKLELEAITGQYSQDQSQLNLTGDVFVKDSDGYILQTQKLDVDLTQGRAESHNPVSGSGKKGTIQSEGLIIEDKGSTIIFEGKSKLLLK